MKLKAITLAVTAAALIAAAPATAAKDPYVAGVTDFPSASTGASKERYIPGVTDFPSASTGAVRERYVPGVTDFPTVGAGQNVRDIGWVVIGPKSPVAVSTPTVGFQWGDATIGALVGSALAALLLGSALLLRRRVSFAH